jgi:O-antigen/teichoic acid export membrane protein
MSSKTDAKQTDAGVREAKRVGRDAGILMVGDLFDRGLGFGFLILATKLYGLETYGAYVAALSLFQIVRAIVSVGLGKSLVRDVAAALAVDDAGRLRGSIQLGFLLSLPLAIVCGTALMFGAQAIVAAVLPDKTAIVEPIRVFGLLTPLFAFNFVLLQTLYGLGRIRDMVAANNFVEPVTRLGALGALFAMGMPGTYAIPGAYAVALAVSSVYALAVAVRKVWPTIAGVKAVMRVRETLAFTVPIALNDLATRSFKGFNVGLLTVFRSTRDVGIFDVAFKLAAVAYFFSGSLIGAFRPRIAALLARGENDVLAAETRVYTRWILTFALLPFGLMIAFPADILGILEPQFVPAAPTLRILCIAMLVGQAAGPLMSLLVMSGRSRQSVYCLVLAGSLYAVLALQTVPRLGTVGAALSGLVTIALFVPTVSFYVQRQLKIRIYGWRLAKPIAAALVAAAVAFAVSLALPAVEPEVERHLLRIARGTAICGVYAATYVGILLKLGIEPEERAVLAGAGGKFGRITKKLARFVRG